MVEVMHERVDGYGNIQRYTTMENVTTYKETYSFPYKSSKDVSRPFLFGNQNNILKEKFIRLELVIQIVFADKISYNDYSEQKNNFFKEIDFEIYNLICQNQNIFQNWINFI